MSAHLPFTCSSVFVLEALSLGAVAMAYGVGGQPRSCKCLGIELCLSLLSDLGKEGGFKQELHYHQLYSILNGGKCQCLTYVLECVLSVAAFHGKYQLLFTQKNVSLLSV